MKKRFTILAAAFALLAFLAIPMGMRGQTRDVETFTFADLGYENAVDVTTVLGDDVTLTFDSGTNANNAPKYYNTGTAVRMYTGNTLEVALNNQEGETRITAIDFTFVSSSYAGSLQNWTGSETSVSFTNTASSQARIQVIAVTFSEGGTPTPSTYTVTYDCNGGTSGCPENVTGIEAGTQIQLAAAPTKTDYSFDGWSDGSTTYQAGANYTVNSNVTFTAQWTEIVSGDEQWVLTNLADLTANDVFVIVGNGYAMTNNNGTSSAPVPVAVTISGNEITSTVSSTIKWTVSGDATNGYTFYPNGSTTTWLYCNTTASSSSNNNMRVGKGERNIFELNSNNFLVTKDSYTARYLSIYFNNEEAQDWRGYINTNLSPAMSFYKKVTGGVIPPSITAANVDIAYNATSGSIAYTINNAVTGGTMSVATESDWLTLGQGTTSPISFTCTANSAGTDRTATVTLTYTYNRATVTANVIVTQAGNPDATMTIAEVRAQGTGDVATLGTVTSISGTSNKTAYIQDATAAIVVYGSFTATVGDEIRVSGTLSDYNGLLEITNPVVTVVSSGNTINPELMTIAETVASTNQGWYIRIEGAMVTNISGSGNSQNTTISQGENTIVVRGNLGITAAVNDIISLNGNIGYFNGNQIANPQNVEVQHNTEPSINISNATVNVPAEGEEGTVTVIYENIDENELIANVYFCNAEGVAASYNWIDAEVDDDNNLYYIIDPNNGEARTAYLKVYDSNTNTYSNLVTINQEAYVAPALDYAELPFFFNSGRDDIEGTDGLSHNGLGSDYNVSTNPTTILKFDGTEDWLLLHFLEAPGTLTFDIKGNSFSGGTFKVQTSEDGETYTDLATYTELGNTQSEEFRNLGENIRYIKWIYTEKVSGNVGLGNIHLYEFGGGPVAETYDLTIEPFENLEIFTFVDDELTEPLEGAGTIQVTEGVNVMLSVSAETGYVMQSLMVDGVEHVNDIDEELTYTFVMPNHNVIVSATAVEDVPPTPFEPATYTLATTIESGKTYIIVGSRTVGEVTNYYAMGEQRGNNRGGYAISVDGTTATVETADVHEVVITALEEEGFYSIYDGGYLYAAGSNKNYLRTQDSLDVNAQWSISIDSVFHIVADSSANRNVMQFNYNNDNPIFSCYSSASQSPVYLYVKEEATTTVTQTVELHTGTNWFSTYVDITLDDLKAALVEALPNTSITIKGVNNSTKFTRGRWQGELTWNVTEMYKITVANDCSFNLEGMPLGPAEHSITIAGGGAATWLGFPLNQNMTPTNAFAGFAQNSDKLKSEDAATQYTRGRWNSEFPLEPGKGYVYISAPTAQDRVFVYPASSKAMVK